MARAIDADALKEKYADELSVQRVFDYDAGFVAGIRAALEMPTLTPPNEWVSVENAMPPEHEPVLCIASGRPKLGLTLEEADQLGSWNKADGWIIDEYLDWEDADVSWWMPLPDPPGKEG